MEKDVAKVKNLEVQQEFVNQNWEYLPRDSKGRIRWSSLVDNSQRIIIIESLAQQFVTQRQILTNESLKADGNYSLRYGINEYYPGGLLALKKKLKVDSKKKNRGYWTEDEIRRQTLEFYEVEGNLTLTLLRECNRWDLDGAIRGYYPGGIRQLRKDEQLEAKSKLGSKTWGSWNINTIEEESMKVFNEHHELSGALLDKIGRSDLASAIRLHYPGKINELKHNLGIGENLQSKCAVLISTQQANEELMKLLED